MDGLDLARLKSRLNGSVGGVVGADGAFEQRMGFPVAPLPVEGHALPRRD